jgi:hypothetical protein
MLLCTHYRTQGLFIFGFVKKSYTHHLRANKDFFVFSLLLLLSLSCKMCRYQMKKKALRKPGPNYGYSAKQLATLRGLSLPPPGGPRGYYDSVPPLYGGTLPPAFPHHVPVTRQHSYTCPDDDLDSHYAYIEDVQREIAASRTMPRPVFVVQ